jgi:hypothetical protein
LILNFLRACIVGPTLAKTADSSPSNAMLAITGEITPLTQKVISNLNG